MNLDLVIRSGKHTGKTVRWIQENDLGYLNWIQANRPEMLKEVKQKPKQATKQENTNLKFRDEPIKAIRPNMDFWEQGPATNSIPYLRKMKKDSEL